MTRRYGHPVRVKLADDGCPTLLRWRGADYRVRAILSRWRLRDPWRVGRDATGASDRRYFRLDCDANLICDVYHDAVNDQWVLEVVHD